MAGTIASKTSRKARKAKRPSSGPQLLKMRKLNPDSATSRSNSKVASRRRWTIRTKKIHRADGTVATVFTVKLGSKTFDSDLHHAFTKSIAKARKQNRQKLGIEDYSAESA